MDPITETKKKKLKPMEFLSYIKVKMNKSLKKEEEIYGAMFKIVEDRKGWEKQLTQELL